MRPWSVVIAVFVGILIVFLIASGSDDRTFAGRARAEVNARPAQQVRGAVGGAGPEETIVIIEESELTPPEAAELLAEVRELLADAATQTAEQARDALERALDRLDDAMNAIEDAADDTSNLAVKIRLEQLLLALRAVEAQLELRLDRLEALGSLSTVGT